MFFKKKGFMLLYAIIFLFLTSCSDSQVKIGLMADLTGRASEIGISGRNGAEIAVDEINSKGGVNGRKINLIIKDDKGIPLEAERVDKELISEGILLGIGHFTSGTGVAGYKVFSDSKKLMISPTMSSESLSGLDYYFIRIIGSNKKQGELLAHCALNNKNKKIAVIFEKNNVPYTLEVCKYFKQEFEKGGRQIVLEDSFASSPNIDFDLIADKITKSNADGALIVCGGLDLAIISQKVKKTRPELNIYSGMWAMTDDLIENGGKAVNGIFLPGIYDKSNNNYNKFRNKYFKKYSSEPTFASIYSYETVKIVSEALKACKGKIDTQSVKTNLIKLKSFKGINDDFRIDKNGDTDREYYLFQVKNSQFVRMR